MIWTFKVAHIANHNNYFFTDDAKKLKNLPLWIATRYLLHQLQVKTSDKQAILKMSSIRERGNHNLAIGDNVKTTINGVKEDVTIFLINPIDRSMDIFVWSNGTQQEIDEFAGDDVYGGNILNSSFTHEALKLKLDTKLHEFQGLLNLKPDEALQNRYVECDALAKIYTSPETRDDRVLGLCKMQKLVLVIESSIAKGKDSMMRELAELFE